MIARGYPVPERGFIIRPGGDGARIIRRARLRHLFQPAIILGTLILIASAFVVIWVPGIVNDMRTSQVIAHAEDVTGVSLELERQSNRFSQVELSLVSVETCDYTEEYDDRSGYRSLAAQKTIDGGCEVHTVTSDELWSSSFRVVDEPFSFPALLTRVVSFLVLGLFGALIIATQRKKFSPAAVAARHPRELASAGTLYGYVIARGIGAKTIWDAAVKERRAAYLEELSDDVHRAIAVTAKQRRSGARMYRESQRLRAEIAAMLSGER